LDNLAVACILGPPCIFVCVTINQQESNPDPNPTTKQHATVGIKLNIQYSRVLCIHRII